MNLNNIPNQTIALAGIVQACYLVHQLATTGSADSSAMESSVASILKIDSDSVVEVYGGLAGIKIGLMQLDQQLDGKFISSPEKARYAAQLVYLQKQLAHRADMLETLKIGLAKAQLQAEQFGLMHANVQASLADLYHCTISTLQPRIMVMGDQQYLGSQTTVNKIRTLLLAGIRGVLLWRQCGGRRWKLLLLRNKIQTESRLLLSRI
jgi:high frequency lysogenization protein